MRSYLRLNARMTTDLVRHLSGADLSESAVMALSLSDAKARMALVRAVHGFIIKSVDLLTAPDGNVKLTHSETDRVYAYGLALAPAGLSGWQVCRYRTTGCEAQC